MVLSSAMASLLLASPPPLSTQLHTSHLSFSHSQTLSSSPLSTSSVSVSNSAATSSSPSPIPYPYVYCGRGDKKTAKARPRDKKKGRGPPRLFAPPAPTKKDRFEDNEIVKIEIDESLFTS